MPGRLNLLVPALLLPVLATGFGIPPIPTPPDRDARLAVLRSYSAGGCNASSPPPAVTNAQFVFGAIARGEAPYLEEWVSNTSKCGNWKRP